MQSYTFRNLSQAELLEGIKRNDADLLGWIYLEQYPKVERYVLSNSGTSQEAKDLFQEAFVVLLKNIKETRFKPESSDALHGYLYRIAKNKWIDFLRSSRHKKMFPMDSVPEVAEDEPDEKESLLRKVEASFSVLGANCKELLTRFYYGKQSMAEIADAFNWTEATARNNKYRCVQQLRNSVFSKE